MVTPVSRADVRRKAARKHPCLYACTVETVPGEPARTRAEISSIRWRLRATIRDASDGKRKNPPRLWGRSALSSSQFALMMTCCTRLDHMDVVEGVQWEDETPSLALGIKAYQALCGATERPVMGALVGAGNGWSYHSVECTLANVAVWLEWDPAELVESLFALTLYKHRIHDLFLPCV